MRAFLRAWFVLTLAATLASLLYVAVCGVLLVRAGSRDDGRKADVIVVMGAAQYDGVPSPLLRLRLEHALDLWRAGRAPTIAVTGGKQEGDRFTEAAASRRWLVDNGVPDSAILAEEVGASTWESLTELAPVLREAGVRRAIAVSSRWHVERVVLSLQDLGFEASASAARPSGSSWFDEAHAAPDTLREIVGVAIGRLIGFGRLFDLTG